MNDGNISVSDCEESLPEVRARNRRAVWRVILAVCLVAAIGLGVRLTSFLASRPPRMPPPLKSVPGYYTEDEVMSFITNGISMTAIIAKFGPPFDSTADREGFVHHSWHFPTDAGGPYRNTFCGFSVSETNGIVFSKGSEHVTIQ